MWSNVIRRSHLNHTKYMTDKLDSIVMITQRSSTALGLIEGDWQQEEDIHPSQSYYAADTLDMNNREVENMKKESSMTCIAFN